MSRLLKSWATPPASRPMLSIFCAWRSCSSSRALLGDVAARSPPRRARPGRRAGCAPIPHEPPGAVPVPVADGDRGSGAGAARRSPWRVLLEERGQSSGWTSPSSASRLPSTSSAVQPEGLLALRLQYWMRPSASKTRIMSVACSVSARNRASELRSASSPAGWPAAGRRAEQPEGEEREGNEDERQEARPHDERPERPGYLDARHGDARVEDRPGSRARCGEDGAATSTTASGHGRETTAPLTRRRRGAA